VLATSSLRGLRSDLGARRLCILRRPRHTDEEVRAEVDEVLEALLVYGDILEMRTLA